MDIETLIMTSLSLDTLRSGDNIFKSVLMLALMYGVKQIGSLSKVATEHVKKWCEKRVEEKMETVISNVQSTIVFTREFDSGKQPITNTLMLSLTISVIWTRLKNYPENNSSCSIQERNLT